LGADPAAIRYGYLSSVVILISGVGLVCGILASSLFLPTALTTGWKGIEPYADAYRATGGIITSLSFLAALISCPAYVIQIASIQRLDQRTTGTLGRFGLAFAIMFAGLAGLNYVVQLTVVRIGILAGGAKGIEWLVFQNPTSPMLELDLIGWSLLGLAFLSVVPLFREGKLGRTIRYLLIVNALVSAILLGSLLIPGPTIGLVLLAVVTTTLTCVDILLVVFFRRLLKTRT
jgi:hypothetical protein